MAERISALAGHVTPGLSGLAGAAGPGVRLSERRIESLWLIAAWPGRLAQAGAAAASAAGTEAAPGPGRSVAGSAGTLLRTEPLKWLLASESALDRHALDDADGAVLDLGHARTVIRIEGPAHADLMARLVPLDLRPPAFAKGAVATTGLHHVGVLVHRRGDGIDLYVPRSYGLAFFEHALWTAQQFGVEVA